MDRITYTEALFTQALCQDGIDETNIIECVRNAKAVLRTWAITQFDQEIPVEEIDDTLILVTENGTLNIFFADAPTEGWTDPAGRIPGDVLIPLGSPNEQVVVEVRKSLRPIDNGTQAEYLVRPYANPSRTPVWVAAEMFRSN